MVQQMVGVTLLLALVVMKVDQKEQQMVVVTLLLALVVMRADQTEKQMAGVTPRAHSMVEESPHWASGT